MTKTLFNLGLVAMMSVATAGFAQDATATEEDAAPAAETTAEDATAAPEDLNMGVELDETGQAALQPGQPYIREEFGAWALRCIKAPEGEADPCQLYQLLEDENGNALSEISMFPLENGGEAKAGATIVVPLETLLTQPLTLKVDNGQARGYPYSFCNVAGCVARLGFSQADVDAFKAGAEATLTLVPAAAPDQRVSLTISLDGFTAGITATDAQ